MSPQKVLDPAGVCLDKGFQEIICAELWFEFDVVCVDVSLVCVEDAVCVDDVVLWSQGVVCVAIDVWSLDCVKSVVVGLLFVLAG